MDSFSSVTNLKYVSCKVKPPPWDTPAVKEARRDMRTKLRLAIKNKDSGYNNKKSPGEIMRMLGTIRGPLNLRTSVTS